MSCFWEHAVPALSEREQQTLASITKMMQNSIRCTWEGNAGTVEGESKHIITDILEWAFRGDEQSTVNVDHEQAQILDQDSRTSNSVDEGQDAERHMEDILEGQYQETFDALCQRAVDRIRSAIPEVGSLAIFDIKVRYQGHHGNGKSA